MEIMYDAATVHSYAARLYARARNCVVSYPLLGIGLGLSLGYIVAGLLGPMGTPRMPYEALGILIFGGTGFSLGSSRALALRLQAQTALCQIRIEENTRGPSLVRTGESYT